MMNPWFHTIFEDVTAVRRGAIAFAAYSSRNAGTIYSSTKSKRFALKLSRGNKETLKLANVVISRILARGKDSNFFRIQTTNYIW